MLMTPRPASKALRGPTVATLRAIETVLRKEAVPLSRYKIRQAMGNRVGGPLLDEALDYMAEHGLVYDEGPGGSVVWIKTSARTLARLRRV